MAWCLLGQFKLGLKKFGLGKSRTRRNLFAVHSFFVRDAVEVYKIIVSMKLVSHFALVAACII
jgi:hypothetical protein